jgi:hypothetical protein
VERRWHERGFTAVCLVMTVGALLAVFGVVQWK